MRKLILTALTCVAFVFTLGAGQQNITGKHRAVFAGCPFTDSFSGSGALGPSWTFATSSNFSPNEPNGTLVRASGVAQQSTDYNQGSEFISNSSCSFTEDQYVYSTVEAYTVGSLSLYILGSALTGSNGNGYGVTWTVGNQGVLKLYNGATVTTLSSTCGTIAITDVVGISITGTGGSQAVNVYVNTGSGFGSPVCSATDDTFTTGVPGIGITNADAILTHTEFGPVTAGNGAI